MFDKVQNTSLGVKEIKTRESGKFDMFYLNTFVIKENKKGHNDVNCLVGEKYLVVF